MQISLANSGPRESCWDTNSSYAENGIFRLCGINNMPADDLAPKVARASTGTVLTAWDDSSKSSNSYKSLVLYHGDMSYRWNSNCIDLIFM